MKIVGFLTCFIIADCGTNVNRICAKSYIVSSLRGDGFGEIPMVNGNFSSKILKLNIFCKVIKNEKSSLVNGGSSRRCLEIFEAWRRGYKANIL